MQQSVRMITVLMSSAHPEVSEKVLILSVRQKSLLIVSIIVYESAREIYAMCESIDLHFSMVVLLVLFMRGQ